MQLKKNNFVRGSAFALWQELTEEMQKLEKGGVVENYVVVVRAAAIHWFLLPCDGVTRQSVE